MESIRGSVGGDNEGDNNSSLLKFFKCCQVKFLIQKYGKDYPYFVHFVDQYGDNIVRQRKFRSYNVQINTISIVIFFSQCDQHLDPINNKYSNRYSNV